MLIKRPCCVRHHLKNAALHIVAVETSKGSKACRQVLLQPAPVSMQVHNAAGVVIMHTYLAYV